MEKKENRFLVLAKRMSRNTNAMIGQLRPSALNLVLLP